MGLPKQTYGKLFGAKPKRPSKGGIVDTGKFTLRFGT
ncbi:MAG: hypothetical protein AB2552_08845 [Candidatus Thiodiazotropha endolucinida]